MERVRFVFGSTSPVSLGEEVVAAGVRVARDVFEHGLDIAAPIVDDVGLVADLDLGLLGGDGNFDGVAAVGHVPAWPAEYPGQWNCRL